MHMQPQLAKDMIKEMKASAVAPSQVSSGAAASSCSSPVYTLFAGKVTCCLGA